MGLKKRRVYEKIINIILDILIFIFGIILLISIYNNVQIKILGNEYSSFFGYSMFEVQTGSMADTINPGDWIVVKTTKNVKLDDIITYSQEGEFITHRVVEAYKDTYVTKGDANNSKDDAIHKEQIVGKVEKILPGLGIIRKTFFNPLVLITLIITLYTISYLLRSIIKKEDEDSDRKNSYRDKLDKFIKLLITKLLDIIKKYLKKNKKTDKKTSEIEDALEEDFIIEIPEINKEDIDKTLYFRTVTVDKNDVENLDLKTKKNDESEKEVEEVVVKIDTNEVEEKINSIQSRNKKFKNLIDKAICFKKEEINEIINVLVKDDIAKRNEQSIKKAILDAYIDAKYYNYCGNVNVEFNKRNIVSRIDKELKQIGENLINKYKGNDNKYEEKVNKWVDIFVLVNSLEHLYLGEQEMSEKKEAYKNKIIKIFNPMNEDADDLKDIIKEIIKIQKLYHSVNKHILEKVNTNMFKLVTNKISGNKNLYAVSLEHNILFSKVYSEYIVDKTYTEGIIAEDKVMVLLNLLLAKIVKDMFDFEDNVTYFIHIPNSIYMKPNKMDKIFKLFEDEYAKNNIIVAVKYDDLIKCNKQITLLRKRGYRFAIIFDNDTKINNEDQKFISVAEYLFIDKKIMSYSLISSIPGDLVDSIINDNIIEKLSSFGGE